MAVFNTAMKTKKSIKQATPNALSKSRWLAACLFFISVCPVPLRAQDRLPGEKEQSAGSSPETVPAFAVERRPDVDVAPDVPEPAAEPPARATVIAQPPATAAKPPAAAPTVQPSRPAVAPQAQDEATPATSPGDSSANEPLPTPPKTDATWGQDRVLGGHLFPAATFVPMALSTSYVGVRAGAAYHSVPGYSPVLLLSSGQEPRRVELQTVNVTEQVDFALRLHDYIALFGDGYGRGRVGANIETLLGTETGSGADYTYGGDVGALVKIVRIGGIQLAVRGQVGYYAGQKAGISALFQDLTAIATDTVNSTVEQLSQALNPNNANYDQSLDPTNPNFDLNALKTAIAAATAKLNASFAAATKDLITPFHGVAYGASVNLAIALGNAIGLQGSLGYSSDTVTYQPTKFDAGLGTSVLLESKETTTRPYLAAAVDLDAGPIGLPIDILVEYRATPISVKTESEGASHTESSLESLIALGVYYSGRNDLQLGLTGYTLLGQAAALSPNGATSDKPQDFGAQLVFRYFW